MAAFPYIIVMNYILALIIFGLCFGAMAFGLIFAKKALKRGCGFSPEDCACKKEGKDPSECDTTPEKKVNS